VHRFNVSGKRKGTKKSLEDIVDVQVPPIIEKEEFDEVQAIMKSRAAQLKAPRFVNASTPARWRGLLRRLRRGDDPTDVRQG
jgi:hypothetical protein